MSSKKYDLLVFDFDGTLVHTITDIAYYANFTLSAFGYPEHPEAAVQKAVGWGVHELLKKLEPDFVSDAARLEEAVAFFKKHYEEIPARFAEPYPHVREMLSGPLAAVKKAILTNKPQEITLRILRELDIDVYFEGIVGLHAGFPPKPDPAGMLHLMKKLGVSPEKTLFVGDSGVDAETSRNAGVDFGFVEYGYDADAGQSPAFRFKNAGEWAKLV